MSKSTQAAGLGWSVLKGSATEGPAGGQGVCSCGIRLLTQQSMESCSLPSLETHTGISGVEVGAEIFHG